MKKVLKKLCLFAAVVVLIPIAIGCSSDDNDVNENSKEQEQYSKFMTPEMEEAVKKLGMEVNKGANPPDVSGYYLIERIGVKSIVPSDPNIKGKVFNSSKTKLYDYDKAELKISLLGYEVESGTDNLGATSTAEGTFITGEGDKFSIFFEEEFDYDDGGPVVILLTILSGELDRDESGEIKGIKNVRYAILMKENNGRPEKITNGTGRLFKDDYADVISKEKFETLVQNKTTGNKKAVSSLSLFNVWE
ncbi:MAG: hypothetical protein LBQ84_04005 [Flavobacteriaceae bacterium]|jgi:hypothetical protein|nr:hypothetical protein [Flavobacteriaceae bacterium]